MTIRRRDLEGAFDDELAQQRASSILQRNQIFGKYRELLGSSTVKRAHAVTAETATFGGRPRRIGGTKGGGAIRELNSSRTVWCQGLCRFFKVTECTGPGRNYRSTGNLSPADLTAAVDTLKAFSASSALTFGGLLPITQSTKAAISMA
jgi:hypothetical protein